jgi:hypothetical protein
MNDNLDEHREGVMRIPVLSFNLVFLCVFALTISFGIGHFYVSNRLGREKLEAWNNHQSVNEKSAAMSDWTKLDSDLYGLLTLGCGSIFGLFGGRALK